MADYPSILDRVVTVIQFSSPLLIAFYFIVSSALSICLLQTISLKVKDQHVRRDVIIWLSVASIAAFAAEAVTLLISSLVARKFCNQGDMVYLLSSILVWGIELLVLSDTEFPVWYPYYGSWFLGILFEALLITTGQENMQLNPWGIIRVVLQGLRLLLWGSLALVFFRLRNRKEEYDNSAAERQSLLRKKLAPKPSSEDSTEEPGSSSNGHVTYGTTESSSSETVDGGDEEAEPSDAESEDSYIADQKKGQILIAKRLKEDGSWWTYVKGFYVFLPYVWPVNDRYLQFRAALVGACLLSSNALNVLTPRQLGIATDSLVDGEGSGPWVAVSLYILFRFLNSGSCLGWIQKYLWMPLELYAYDALSTASHSHIMNLSSEFHDNKTSSEISSAVHQGRSVSNMVETIIFQVLPMLIDLLFAYFYLFFAFGPYMALVTAFTTTSYLYLTSKMVAMRAANRREYIKLARKEWIVAYQGLDGWRSASLFNNIPYEEKRYAGAVKDRLKVEKHYRLSYQAMFAAQGVILTLGLLGGSFLAVYQVTNGSKSAGSFVTLLTYWGQLSSPLAFFSRMYSDVSNDMMDAERLLELFQTKPSIIDAPNAKPLELKKGNVKFTNVYFSYDKKKNVLNGVDFEVAPGTTIAIVGETGGGKSTILKLLDRFYDVTEGSIEIDGQDIRHVTLQSLRDKIGVVPQDPALFNDTIMSNIKYAKLGATDKEVEAACEAAAIHSKIQTFPDKYDSKVGEHGVKLSGGEQQRVAIARAILKHPDIILLDEATSAVDTETEELIQDAFRALCANRTTFIVAHRLSTIMRADKILVMKAGQIIETGTHDELIRSKGKYHDLWSKQVFFKPTTNRARSSSPVKGALELVNDLTQEQSAAEVSKAIKAGRECQNTENPTTKAAIPDVFSRETRPTTPTHDNDNDTSEMNGKNKGEADSLAKKKGKEVADSSNGTNGEKMSREDSNTGGSSSENKQAQSRHRVRRPKQQRRNQARTEPQSTRGASTDGAQDSDKTVAGSGAASGPTPSVRRASDPSSQPVNSQGHGDGPRVRRTRRNSRRKQTTAAAGGQAESALEGTSSEDQEAPLAPRPNPVTVTETQEPESRND